MSHTNPKPTPPREWTLVYSKDYGGYIAVGAERDAGPIAVVPAADLLAALAEIDKMRRTHNEWVSEQGERTRTRDEIIACLKKERDEALELLAEWNALGETLLAKRHAKSGND